MMGETLTGGCQCGAVRFAASNFSRPSICHCRMCQKAYGGFFGALVTVKNGCFTRGEPKWFESSNMARRGFCENCGTPLAYDTKYGLEFSIGAFDDPDKIAPIVQVNLKDKLKLYDRLSGLPIRQEIDDEWEDFLSCVKSNQHPDFETKNWQVRGSDNEA
jgi:hypothetical protein